MCSISELQKRDCDKTIRTSCTCYKWFNDERNVVSIQQ